MSDEETPALSGVKRRGFASMSAERRREVSSKGGSSVAPEHRSFSQNRDLAASAGDKGRAARWEKP